MVNLFDEINKFTDDELRLQTALFENATLSNAVKETGFRFMGGIKELANAFTESLGGKAVLEYDVKKMSDMVREGCLELKIKDRGSLISQLKQIIVKAARELSAAGLGDDESDIRLTKVITDEAAKVFSIEKYKPVANKMDEIIIEYNNAFLKTLHSQLIKEDAKQAAVSDKLIQSRMNAVSMDTKRQLQQQLRPVEFNGTGVGRVLRGERGTKNLEIVLRLLGREAFDTAGAEVWTILMAMKGLKRPGRMQLARIIWVAGEHAAAKYAVSREELPGYIPAKQKAAFLQSEQEFKDMMLAQNKRIKKLEQTGQELERQRAQQQKDEERFKECEQRLELQKDKFSELESKKQEYYEGRKSDVESKAYYASVNETKRNLDQAETEYYKLKERLKKQEEKTEETSRENDSLQKDFDCARLVLMETAGQRIKRLKSSWNTYFYKFKFSDEAVSYVAINLTREEQLNIESRLKELHEAQNPADYKDGQAEDRIIFYCFTAQGKAAVIELKDRMILNISKKE
ncbi:MAG: hypothetical protein Q4F11_02950 [Eubacteriales bacterium]|nr:hypothetical protein [Eubacteriales bacterium]